jgi:hypothetical protein
MRSLSLKNSRIPDYGWITGNSSLDREGRFADKPGAIGWDYLLGRPGSGPDRLAQRTVIVDG